MKITQIEIQNFKSIYQRLVIPDIGDLLILTGKNNSGKSNILKALDLFFNNKVGDRAFSSAFDINLVEAKRRAHHARLYVDVFFAVESQKDKMFLRSAFDTNKFKRTDSFHVRLYYGANDKCWYGLFLGDETQRYTFTFDRGIPTIKRSTRETRGADVIQERERTYNFVEELKKEINMSQEQT